MGCRFDQAEKRVKRYWYEDGLTEIAGGLLCLLIGALFVAEASLPSGTLPRSFSAVGLLVVVLPGGWVASRIVAAVKSRVTYPRTGYVAYRRPSARSRWAIPAAAAAVGALLAVVLARAPRMEELTPALQGLLFAVVFYRLGHGLGLARLQVAAVGSVLLGAAAAWLDWREPGGMGLYFTGMGILILALGCHALRRYLRETEPMAGASTNGG